MRYFWQSFFKSFPDENFNRFYTSWIMSDLHVITDASHGGSHLVETVSQPAHEDETYFCHPIHWLWTHKHNHNQHMTDRQYSSRTQRFNSLTPEPTIGPAYYRSLPNLRYPLIYKGNSKCSYKTFIYSYYLAIWPSAEGIWNLLILVMNNLTSNNFESLEDIQNKVITVLSNFSKNIFQQRM